jgi:hypothetical protein
MAISVGILGWVYATNDVDVGSLNDTYTAVVIGTVALVVGVPTVDSLTSFVTSSDTIALGAVAVQSAGYAAMSYMR